jgi:hypothetical protein
MTFVPAIILVFRPPIGCKCAHAASASLPEKQKTDAHG